MKVYYDYKSIYKFNSDGISVAFPIVDDNDELIITGTHISEFEENADFPSNNFGFSFIDNNYDKSKIKFYCVPFVDVFAYDENGYYATFNDFTSDSSDAKIIYIDNALNMYFAAKNFSDFVNTLLNGSLKKYKDKMNDLTIYSSYAEAKKHLEKYIS